MAWTDELKQKAISQYTEGNPTPENSTELIKQIADELEQSPNGVRMILIQAGVYVKKDATAEKGSGTKTTGTKAGEDKKPRVSKESQLDALRAAIKEQGAEVDEEIVSKLTGKAAAYFTAVLNT